MLYLEGMGNANFLYASTLVFGIANGAALMDLAWVGSMIELGEMVGGYEVVRQYILPSPFNLARVEYYEDRSRPCSMPSQCNQRTTAYSPQNGRPITRTKGSPRNSCTRSSGNL